jgi:hypothetical protein
MAEPLPSEKDSEPFDINANAKGFILPSVGRNIVLPKFGKDGLGQIETFAKVFEESLGAPRDESGFHQAVKALCGSEFGPISAEVAKALNAPPSAFSYARMNMMPDPNAVGVMPWPGIAPEALGKIARENVAPQLVIGMRIDDILRYSEPSSQPWRPGWRIEPFQSDDETPGDSVARDIREAERFILNSNIETKYGDARDRDAKFLTGFQSLLSAGTRDWLTYDGLAIWTDMDNQRKVKGYAALPAGNIRLANREGYNKNPQNFAVFLNDQGRIEKTFTRDELIFRCRNARTNIEISGGLFASGYGLPEIEITIRLIQGFQNAIDLNVDVFSRNGIPNGILTIVGATQRQLDFINRLWTNLKRGVTKAWALPVMGMPNKDAKVDILDLSRLKGNEVYYGYWMNMLAGAFATIYRFPPKRLGYRISGRGKDSEPGADSAAELVDEEDPGLAPLLGHWQTLINEYLLWSRWPHLMFRFTGANPREDARQYESRRNAMTWNEARKSAGLEPLEATYPSEHILLGQIMGAAPIDANLSGIYQTIAASYLKIAAGVPDQQEATPGSTMSEKKDPARSELHGHVAGIRRNSAAETGKGEMPKTLFVSRPLLNSDSIIAWAHDQGFKKTLKPEDMHATIAFSRSPVIWSYMDRMNGMLRIPTSKENRTVKRLGDKGAVVLTFRSTKLSDRWSDLCDSGCSWDYEGFDPHVTITYDGDGIDLSKTRPYDGPLVFGPEKFNEVVDDWDKKITEQ